MTYDSAWEASIRQLRSQDRLLAVRSLHYRVPQSEIKALCKAKLSNKGVVFHWRQDGVKASHKHLSWVFIEAETTAEREVAIVELANLLVKGRPVKVGAVARRAKRRVPLAQPRQGIAASAAGPSTTITTTTTTTTTTALVATTAPVEPPTPPPIVAAVALRVSAAPAANVAADSPSAPSSVIAAASNEIATTSISEETDEQFARRTQGVGMVPISVRTKDDEESEDSDED